MAHASPPSPDPRPAGRSRGTAWLAVSVAVALAAFAWWRTGNGVIPFGVEPATPSATTASATNASAGTSAANDLPQLTPAKPRPITAFQVRNLTGAIESVVVPGEPGVIMINSRTCGYCKKALADLGRYANGRPVPRLRLLTLEGAEAGVPGIEAEGIVGAALLGPVNSAAEIAMAFRYQGTPTFIAVDRDGRPVVSMPGYPGAEALAPWFDVMLGDRDVN